MSKPKPFTKSEKLCKNGKEFWGYWKIIKQNFPWRILGPENYAEAIENIDKTISYFVLHNESGPSVINESGEKAYCLHGKTVSEERWLQITRKNKLKKLLNNA